MKSPYFKGHRFRVPGRRLPPPSEARLSDRVKEDKKKEGTETPIDNIYFCIRCGHAFHADDGFIESEGFICYSCKFPGR